MEQWKAIEGFPAYAVSNLGRVKRTLPGPTRRAGTILKLSLSPLGYLRVELWDGPLTRKLWFVHLLVAEAFIPNPLNLPEVNHKGEKSDNRATKLEWRSKAGHGRDIAKRKQRGDGVHLYKRSGMWRAIFYPEPGKQKHIGTYPTKKQALEARDRAVEALTYIP